MILDDYRALQRTDLRDTGTSLYFTNAELDGFHLRALREYQNYQSLLKPWTLVVTAGVDTVGLPTDWAGVHRPSFEVALGLSGAYQAIPTGYGVVYTASDSIEQALPGASMDFASNVNPYAPWTTGPTAPPTYTFMNGFPPQLVIRPAPAAAATYPIFYMADHQLPLAAPASAPTALASATGGTIPAGTYYIKITYSNANGETTASPESAAVVTSGATSTLTVTGGPLPANATKVSVYLTPTAAAPQGSEVLAGSYTTGSTLVITALPVAGAAAPPTVGTATGTLPDREARVILAYACHLACEALLGDTAKLQSIKAGDREVKMGDVVKALQEKSKTQLALFDRWTRQRPMGGLA